MTECSIIKFKVDFINKYIKYDLNKIARSVGTINYIFLCSYLA